METGRGQAMDFREADRRYAELKRQYDAETISEEDFDEQRRSLMVRDERGRWWAKSRSTDDWMYKDGDTWRPGTPPYRNGGPSAAAEVVLWILVGFCALLVVLTIVIGAAPGYFTALLGILGIFFAFLARRTRRKRRDGA